MEGYGMKRHVYVPSSYPDGSSTCVFKEDGKVCDFIRETKIHLKPIDWKKVQEAINASKQRPDSTWPTKEFEYFFGSYNDFPPHWKKMKPDDFWARFSQSGIGSYQSHRQMLVRDSKAPGGYSDMIDATLFFYSDGTGIAVNVKWDYEKSLSTWTPTFYRFALCEHERVSTLNTRRGWHEGFCRKCGLGMNYDSSD